MTLGLVSLFSNSQCVSHFAALRHNLSCQDTDVVNASGSTHGIYLKTNSQLGLSLVTTDTCIMHKQTNKNCASRATTTLTTQIQQACGTNKEKKTAKTPRRVSKRERTTSSTWATDKLDYISRFVRVIPTFSQHCHKTVTYLNKLRCGRCKKSLL